MNSNRLLPVVILLQLATLAFQVRPYLGGANDDEEEESSLEEIVSELREDISTSRYELANQAERLQRMLDQLAANGEGGPGRGPQAGLGAAPDLDISGVTESDLLFRLLEVNELHRQYKIDPIQRLPVEKERARIEEELRRRGDETIGALGLRFKEIRNTVEQTRMLTHVVAEIPGDAAIEFAYRVFQDEGISSGVRLVGATIARAKHGDEIDASFVKILSDPDTAFSRREQIIVFFKENHYPPAGPALARLAIDPEVNRLLRRYTLQALGSYPDPEAIDALKQVATEAIHGDLRAEALRSLDRILGREILDFLQFVRGRLTEDDPLHRLLDDLEASHRDGG